MVARVSSAGGRAHTQPLSEGSGATAGSPRAAEKPAVTSTEQVGNAYLVCMHYEHDHDVFFCLGCMYVCS